MTNVSSSASAFCLKFALLSSPHQHTSSGLYTSHTESFPSGVAQDHPLGVEGLGRMGKLEIQGGMILENCWILEELQASCSLRPLKQAETELPPHCVWTTVHLTTPVFQANNDILAFLSGMPVTRNTKYLDLKNSVSWKSLPLPVLLPTTSPQLHGMSQPHHSVQLSREFPLRSGPQEPSHCALSVSRTLNLLTKLQNV